MKVLDASAVLAFLFGEPGGHAALAAFPAGLLSVVNAVEVMSKARRDGVAPEVTLSKLQRLGLTLVDANSEQAVRSAALASIADLSLGDRFCIALAQARGVPVVTADRIWAAHDFGVPVELIR